MKINDLKKFDEYYKLSKLIRSDDFFKCKLHQK